MEKCSHFVRHPAHGHLRPGRPKILSAVRTMLDERGIPFEERWGGNLIVPINYFSK